MTMQDVETTQTQPETTAPTLAGELQFSPDDLAANREGKLSEMQDYKLRVRRHRAVMIGLSVLMAVIVVATLLIFAGTREGGSGILAVIGAGITVCNAALMAIFGRHWMRLHSDIQGGVVEATTGELERVIKPISRRVVNYMIRVEDAEVFVSQEAFEAFEHEATYTLYRAPSTGTLLAAEKVE